MKRHVSLFLVCMLLLEPLFGAVRGKDSMYVGGSVTSIARQTKGRLTTEDTHLKFVYKGGSLEIPYSNVKRLEYGQHAGRRVGAAIAGAAAFGVGALPILFSKKKKHFLTVAFEVDNKSEATVFEINKHDFRAILATLEAKTGKKVGIESEEAQKRSSP